MQVLILCGSASDLPVMEKTAEMLREFGVSFALHVASAHRTPDRVKELIRNAESSGAKVIIAAAGLAAHLAGAVASSTVLPVIGVPMDGGPLKGQDALLSTVQMPPGIPVASMAIGKPGAVNSALFAIEILALSDAKLSDAMKAWRKEKAKKTIESDPALTQ